MESFSVMSRSRSQGTEVTIVTGDVFMDPCEQGFVSVEVCMQNF